VVVRHQRVKNDTEIRDECRGECQELNYSNCSIAVSVLRYSFGIINWRLEEIRHTDRKNRKVLTMYKMHHPKADIDRLYVKRKED